VCGLQFPRTTVREVKVLKSLQHPNLVQLREIVTSTVLDGAKDPEDEQDKAGSIFLVFEYLPYDLAALVEAAQYRWVA
jgi:cyclin-dependent kinase 12/13